jgi:Bacterial capsule synthesis protein PGA_cap
MAARRNPRAVALLAIVALLAACDSPTASPSTVPLPTPAPSATASPAPSNGPSTEPSPGDTQGAVTSFPLAVVTGLTNLKAVITVEEIGTLAASGRLLVPCGVTVDEPAITPAGPCTPAEQMATAIAAKQKQIALLPPGLVQPATKVLPIAGTGPFGLFGPDLFGDPESRALPYPVQGSATGDPGLDPAWTAYDAAQTWTMTSVGSMCADRDGARQAVTLGKGWDWIFDGGTARYRGGPIPNPNPPPGIDLHPIVRPVETGNDGVTAKLISRADVTLGDHKCPIQPTRIWSPCCSSSFPSLAVPEAVVSRWQDFLGIDAVYLAADHQSDRGVAGIRSTLQILDKHDIPHTGLGMDLDAALEPAYVEVAGRKVAFVSWNNVPGPAHADASTAGVAWLNRANIDAAVARARSNADLVICDPQWWGPDEYRPDLSPRQTQLVSFMDAAGCDQIVGGGLHLSGAIYLRQGAAGPSFVNVGPGNFLYGQDFWQQTQEGVVIEQTFVGTRLVNLRLHPYVMILAARPALLDPEGDGHYVLQRIWKISDLRGD